MDQSTLSRLSDVAAHAAHRPNLYTAVHKGLRACMAEALIGAGSADAADPREVTVALARVRALLDLCLSHLEHENAFVHRAMERAQPGSSHRTTDDHDEHLQAITALRATVDVVERADPRSRAAAAQDLYAQLSVFIAHNLEHMHVEETHNMAVLWTHLDDEALGALHGEIVAAIPAEQMNHFTRWIVPSISHAERVEMFEGMRAAAPARAFDEALALARSRLSQSSWSKLASALAVSVEPDPVEKW